MGMFDPGEAFGSPVASKSSTLPSYLDTVVKSLTSRADTESQKPFQAYTGDRVAPLSDDTNTADSYINNLLGKGPTRLIDNIPGQSGGPAGSIQDYMNPYIQSILGPLMAKMQEDQGVQQKSLDAGATMAGAFGDAQHGVATGMLQRNSQNDRADMVNKVLSNAFDTAMGERGQDIDRTHSQTMDFLSKLLGIGQEKDSKAQAGADFNFDEFMRQLGSDKANMSWLSQLLSGTPHDTTDKNSASGGEGTSLLGGIISAIPALPDIMSALPGFIAAI